jgi:hypothetical protein
VRQAVGASVDGAPTRAITEQEVRDAFAGKPTRINQTIADRLMKSEHAALKADDPFAKAIKARDPKIEVATLDLAGQAQKPVYAMGDRMAILTPTGLQELPPGLAKEIGSHKLDWHALKLPPVADTGAVAAAATAAPEAAAAAPAAAPSGGGILGWLKKLRGAKGEIKPNVTPPEANQLRESLDTLKATASTPEQKTAIRDITDWFAKNGTTQDLMKVATSLKNKAGELMPGTHSDMGLLRRALEKLKPSRDPGEQSMAKSIGAFFQRRTDNLKSVGTKLKDAAGKLIPLKGMTAATRQTMETAADDLIKFGANNALEESLANDIIRMFTREGTSHELVHLALGTIGPSGQPEPHTEEELKMLEHTRDVLEQSPNRTAQEEELYTKLTTFFGERVA